MTDQSEERNEPCCVNFDIELKTTKRDKRNILLSIQFSETEIERKFISKHSIRLVLKRCDVRLKLKNCVLPISHKANINPLNISSTSNLTESIETRKKKNKQNSLKGSAKSDGQIDLGAGYEDKSGTEHRNQATIKSDVTTYHIQPGGSESNPTWKFSSSDGKPLVGQFLNESLGEIVIKDRPSHVYAKVSAWKKDITIIDAEGLFAKHILKQKLAAAYILSILDINEITQEKSVDIT